MPLYEYECGVCGHCQDEINSVEGRDYLVLCDICSCGCRRTVPCPAIVTDTNFGYTGKYDRRLGGPKIEGRKDFWDRVEKNELKEVDIRELADKPQTMEKRLKKYKIE